MAGSFSAINLLIGALVMVGAVAGFIVHFARGHIGFGEAEAQHRLGAWRFDGFAQRYLFRADLDASGGWDITSRRNMASMMVAGAMGPLLAGMTLIWLMPR